MPPTPNAAHVHSLLHVNLNTTDAAASSAFYERVLGLRMGMRTNGEPTSGESLGVAGQATTLACFLYDSRGPRAAPALEVLEWRVPHHVGRVPIEPNHAGLAAIGFRVPASVALEAEAIPHGVWPLRSSSAPLQRILDPDGILVELTVDPSAAQPEFSHLRVNVADLAASIEWYAHLGLAAVNPPVSAAVASASAAAVDASVTIASLSTEADPSLSFELTSWEKPRITGRPISPAYHLGLYRIALGVDDVNAACQELRESWPEVPDPLWVELPGTRLGGVTVLFLRDPDGTTVELVQRPRSSMTR